MENSTNINDLPQESQNNRDQGNISLSVKEQSPSTQLDQNTINQIISSLQKAGSGSTQLPSRDIPQNTNGLTIDEQVQPSYIPSSEKNDYINEHEENDDIVKNYTNKQNTSKSLDSLYDEIQIPLLIAILYFLFQLPIFKKIVFQYLPILCSSDGNANIYGYLFNSTLFATIYYLLITAISTFNKF
jgi:hypothetical protein